MDEKLFNKKSVEKAKSPESLDDYIKVSNPTVWLLLASIIILLLGATFWGIFGRVESTVATTVRVQNGDAVCYVLEDYITEIKEGMTVKFDKKEAFITSIGEKENKEYVCELASEEILIDGFYNGKVVTNSYQPWSFVLN